MPSHVRLIVILCALVPHLYVSRAAPAQTVWSGLTLEFTKADGANGELAENQDWITPNVYLARGDIRGLYNAASEPNFLNGTSPEFTAWATHVNNPDIEFDATDHADLVFEEFTTAFGFSVGSSILDGNAVLYLVLDEIYLDIQFTSWTDGNQDPRGGFSYMRAEPPNSPTGDYNNDGFVDAADYTVWRNTLGDDDVPEGSGADGNSNGEIDEGDYLFWKERYGDMVPMAAGRGSFAVPEPATLGILVVAAGLILLPRRGLPLIPNRLKLALPPLIVAIPSLSAQADFHFWYIKEIYSNHDGTVQFIELFTTSAGQQNLFPGHSLTSTGNTFVFPNDSPTPTNNRHLLIATAGFGSIPGGAAPNYTIPSNFFNPVGDTVNFAGVSSHTFGSGNPLPTDGINSLNYTTFFGSSTVAVNSPRNHAGQGTTISLPPPATPTGDYNNDGFVDAADYTVWRNHFGELDETNINDAGDGENGVDEEDYTVWRHNYGEVLDPPGVGGVTTVPEPGVITMSGILATMMLASRRMRHIRPAA